MQATLTHPSYLRDEIESPLIAKYGITLSQRTLVSSHLPINTVLTPTRDEMERLLTARYGLGFVKKEKVGGRDEMAAMLNTRYGLSLKQK